MNPAKEPIEPLKELTLNPIKQVSNGKHPILYVDNFLDRARPRDNSDKRIDEEFYKEVLDEYEKMCIAFNKGEWSYDAEKFIRWLPFTYFQKKFTDEELLMIFTSSFIQHDKDVIEYIENNEQLWVLKKLWLSSHQNGGTGEWNAASKAYYSLKSLSLPGFDIKFDHSSYRNQFGYSTYRRIYLDGSIGILLYKNNKHLLTISLDFRDTDTVRIKQIQCASSKGNRWLFTIPENYISYFTKWLYNHFSSHGYTNIELIKSMVVVESIRENYENLYNRYKNSWLEAKKHKGIWGDSEDSRMRCYNYYREAEAKLVEFDNKDFYRLIRIYSSRIKGLKRTRSSTSKKFNKLILS